MNTSTTPLSIRIVQSLAISSAAVAAARFAGSNICTTVAALPALLQSPPSLLAKQWKSLYDNGILLVVASSMGSAAGFAYLAYDASKIMGLGGSQAKLYIAAATASFSLAPFTRVVMWGVIGQLTTIAEIGKGNVEKEGEKLKAGGEGEVHELVRRWGRLNLVRGLLPLVGAAVGVWAVTESR